MRLFVALDLPGAVAAPLAGWGAAAADADPALRAAGRDALHLTLLFLGERDAAEVPAIAAALGDAVAGGGWPEALEVGEALWLAPRRPHVLTVGVGDPAGAVAALHARLVTGLAAAIGWTAERRALRPHVTVARVRRGGSPRRAGLPERPALAPFTPPAATLWRSHLGSPAARYEALARFERRVAP